MGKGIGDLDKDDEITVDVRLVLKRGQPINPVQVSNAKYVKELYGQLTNKPIKTNAIAGDGPKRGVK